MTQQVFILNPTSFREKQELNMLLRDGWSIVTVTPSHTAAGGCTSSTPEGKWLIVLQDGSSRKTD